MKEFQHKRDFNKKLYSPISLVILFIVAVLLIISTFKIYAKSRNTRLKSEKTKAEVIELEKRRAELEAEIAKTSTESGLEEELRGKFNIKKPGEEVLTIMDKRPEDDKINAGEDNGFFGKIWNFIKNIF
jgi:cell division protein FtsB